MPWTAEQMAAMDRQLDLSEAQLEAAGINPDATTWTAEDRVKAFKVFND